jgi:molecular chaperone HscA
VVAYTPDAVLVGQDAVDVALERPAETLTSIKRLMGRSAGDPEVQATARGHRVFDGEGGMIRIQVGDREVTPVEVSAEILRRLKTQAEKVLRRRVQQAVITVPAYFDDAQRQATRDAGKLAGLEVLRLLNEPTAAALAYGLDQNHTGTYAVYDLGGGTFDISILKLSDGVFEVLSTGGNTHLGGDDLDDAVAASLRARVGFADETQLDARQIRLFRQLARQAKETLSDALEVTLEIPDPSGSLQPVTLSRDTLEAITRPIVEKTGPACINALRDAGLSAAQVDGVVLVGGSTRMPLVRQFVAGLFGREPFTGVDPDQVVALGAAIQAALLTGWKKDVLLLDVIPLSLGLETMGGIVEKLVLRNSTVPASARQVFTTFADGQTAMDIHVVQGERELVSDNRSLARFRLSGIPPLPAGVARVEVTFSVDSDGILRVSAREERTGIEQRIEVKPSYGLTDQDIERMLKEALEHAQEDVEERLLRDARVEADRILAAAEKALSEDGERLLVPLERQVIQGAISQLKTAAAETDHREIRECIEQLDRVSASFAQRRMEVGIQRALSGVQVDVLADELKDIPAGGQPH